MATDRESRGRVKRVSINLPDNQRGFLKKLAQDAGTSEAEQAAQAIRTGITVENLRQTGEIIAEMPDGRRVLVADKEGVMEYRPVTRTE